MILFLRSKHFECSRASYKTTRQNNLKLPATLNLRKHKKIRLPSPSELCNLHFENCHIRGDQANAISRPMSSREFAANLKSNFPRLVVRDFFGQAQRSLSPFFCMGSDFFPPTGRKISLLRTKAKIRDR